MFVDQVVWGEYNVTSVHEEEFSWADIHRFNLLHDYSVSVETSDSDGDTLNDTVSYTYSLNFSSTEFYALEFVVHIFIWDDVYSEWDFLFSDHDYDDFSLINGGIYNWTYQYKAWYDGDYQFIIWIEDDYNPGYSLLVEDTHEWHDAHAFTLLNEWDVVLTELDKDGDSCSDAFSLEYFRALSRKMRNICPICLGSPINSISSFTSSANCRDVVSNTAVAEGCSACAKRSAAQYSGLAVSSAMIITSLGP